MKKYGMKFIRILLLSLALLLLTGCQQSPKSFDHSFLSFEEIFQNALEPELPSFSAAPGAQASSGIPGRLGFKIGRFSSPEEGVIRGGFYILNIGDVLDETLPEDAAVRGVYLITYEKIKDGVRLNNISLSIESDIEIQDFALRLPGPEMETIPLTTGEVQDITLNIERIGESYQHDFSHSGLWLDGMIVREGKEYKIMGMSL
jgi:hypothetical protein